MTRSKKVTYENLRLRDKSFTDKVSNEFSENLVKSSEVEIVSAAFTPFKIRALELPNRIVMAPMGQYTATDGLVSDWHLVHYGSRATGGVGLIITEMTAISETGRITEGCAGIYNAEQLNQWKKITDFIHDNTSTKIAIQLGHSGRKGATKKPWEGNGPMETPWDLISASPIPFNENFATPKEMTLEDMAEIKAQFVQATKNADEAGFDMIELQTHHGFLLASFLSPLTNIRTDEFGENTSLFVKNSDVAGINVGDTVTFRNGDVRTITSLDAGADYTWIYWDGDVAGSEMNPRYPVTVTTQDYAPETKLTARIKPDLSTEGSGQYMDVYVGGSQVLDNKHVHMAGHGVDTEVFLGTDNNFVSSKEAGNSPARVNLKSENDITVTDSNLRMTRGSTWLSVYGDGINRNSHNGAYDLAWNVVTNDDHGNFYVGGESAAYSEAMVGKYGPDGDLIWKKLVNGDNINGWQLDGIAYNSVNKEVGVAVQTNWNRNYNYYKLNVLDSETGAFKSALDIYDPDGNILITNMVWDSTLGYVAVGNTYGEKTTSDPITGVGSTGIGIIELPVASVKVGGAWPDINSGNWFISGTGITGDQVFTFGGPGLYRDVPVINLTNPTDSGLTVGIRVIYSGGYYDYFLSGQSGTGVWAFNDDFKILGSNLGGVDGGTTVLATTIEMITGGGGSDAAAFFTKADYPDLYNQLNACAWTVSFNTNTYNVLLCESVGDNWRVLIQNCADLTGTAMSFYTAQGNDILGKVADANGIQNGFTGTPNVNGYYHIDMGYQMGYPSTDFTGGTFTISAIADSRAFVWTEAWTAVYNPVNKASTSAAYSVAVSKTTGDVVVGGYDNSSGKGFVWKLDSSGTTQWVKGLDNDNGNNVYGVAISDINGLIYCTTNYNSINKFSFAGALVQRIEPQGPWGHNSPIIKLRQELDGTEYLYVGGLFGGMWPGNTGYLVSKFDSNLQLIWTRDFWSENRDLRIQYDSFHNNFAISDNKAVLVGWTYVGSFNNANAFVASISTDDNFDVGLFGNWHTETPGGWVGYGDVSLNYQAYDLLNAGGTTNTGSMITEGGTAEHTWTNWSWKTSVIKLDNSANGVVGVEKVAFAEGGDLDHNPSDIPPVFTDFNVGAGWNYTLQLSDRGKFIVNEPVPNGGYCDNLYITVPSNNNVAFPVGTVITLINTNEATGNGYRIYVRPENYPSNDCPRIWAAGTGNQNNSTWSFQGMQTATLMKIGSNEWLLTANNIQNED